jgi:hypothetical protein
MERGHLVKQTNQYKGKKGSGNRVLLKVKRFIESIYKEFLNKTKR